MLKRTIPFLVLLFVNYVVAQQGFTIFVTLFIQQDSFVCQFQSQILTGYFAGLNELHTHMLYLCTTPTMPLLRYYVIEK